jgi:hypothetical protein
MMEGSGARSGAGPTNGSGSTTLLVDTTYSNNRWMFNTEKNPYDSSTLISVLLLSVRQLSIGFGRGVD